MSDPEREDDESPGADQDSNVAHFELCRITGHHFHWNHLVPTEKLDDEPKGGFPVPHKYTDVDGQTDTLLDELQYIDDCWNVGRDGLLSDPWVGVTRFTIVNRRTS